MVVPGLCWFERRATMDGTEEVAVVAQFNGFLMSRSQSLHFFNHPFSHERLDDSQHSNGGGPSSVVSCQLSVVNRRFQPEQSPARAVRLATAEILGHYDVKLKRGDRLWLLAFVRLRPPQWRSVSRNPWVARQRSPLEVEPHRKPIPKLNWQDLLQVRWCEVGQLTQVVALRTRGWRDRAR